MGAVTGSLRQSRVNDVPAFWPETTKRSPREAEVTRRLAGRGAQESRPAKLLTDWRAHLRAAHRRSALGSLPKTLRRELQHGHCPGPPSGTHGTELESTAWHQNHSPEELVGACGLSPTDSITCSGKNVNMRHRPQTRPRVSQQYLKRPGYKITQYRKNQKETSRPTWDEMSDITSTVTQRLERPEQTLKQLLLNNNNNKAPVSTGDP